MMVGHLSHPIGWTFRAGSVCSHTGNLLAGGCPAERSPCKVEPFWWEGMEPDRIERSVGSWVGEPDGKPAGPEYRGDIVYPEGWPNWEPTHWREADLPDYWPYESQEAFVAAALAGA